MNIQQSARWSTATEAQREAVSRHVGGAGGVIVAEFQEVESGKKNDRPQIAAALAACRLRHATLVIANLDRLARNLHFISSLMLWERNKKRSSPGTAILPRFESFPILAGALGAFTAATPAHASLVADGITYTLTEQTVTATTDQFTLGISGIQWFIGYRKEPLWGGGRRIQFTDEFLYRDAAIGFSRLSWAV